jgi:hypothetical protein
MKQPRSLVEKAFMLELERGLAAPKKSFDELVYTVDLEQYRLPYSRYGWTRKFWIALGSATAGTALTVTVVISVYFGLGLFHGNGGPASGVTTDTGTVTTPAASEGSTTATAISSYESSSTSSDSSK